MQKNINNATTKTEKIFKLALAKFLKSQRMNLKLSQEDFAIKLNLSTTGYKNIESAKSNIKLNTIAKIVTSLNTQPDSFFYKLANCIKSLKSQF